MSEDTTEQPATSSLTLTRLTNELSNLNAEREAYYQVMRDPKDIFKYYFMMRGDDKSDYNNGYYIGRIELPADYPQTPGNFFMLTPSGRFEINKKICLTNSGYHKETWSPMWNLKNMVIAFASIFGDDSTSGISHIKMSSADRKKFAAASQAYNLKENPAITKLFTQFVKEDGTFRSYKETDEYISNINKEQKEAKLAALNEKKAKKEAIIARKEAKKAKIAAWKKAAAAGVSKDQFKKDYKELML